MPLFEEIPANVRIKVKDPRTLFELVKSSPKYLSWNKLVKETGCGNTTLKQYKRGERTFSPKSLEKLFVYLTDEQKNSVMSTVEFLDSNWGAVKGGQNSIKNKKEKLGETGFLIYLEKIRTCSEFAGLSGWHKKMKMENRALYSQIQRKRWRNVLKVWSKIPEIKQKRVKTLKTRFGENFFLNLGLKTAEGQELNKRETFVKQEIDSLGFEVEVHKTIGASNFDFVYTKDNQIKAVEEVLGFKKESITNFVETP